MKRTIDIVVISDIHLGTYGCHAKELLSYLKSIKPGILILNGDIFDIWQFNKRYFPTEHLQVINRIIKMASMDTKVFYITGNHDEKLRAFSNLQLANIQILDQLELLINSKKYWFFHGDVFDISINNTKIIAKIGGLGYDTLIRINRFINDCRTYFGYEKISFSKKIKYSVKEAVKFIQNFEDLGIKAALKKDVDYVVCGHIHQPTIKTVEEYGKKVIYMNSGDWVENLTALEYSNGNWSVYEYDNDVFSYANPKLEVKDINNKKNVSIQLGKKIFEPLEVMNF